MRSSSRSTDRRARRRVLAAGTCVAVLVANAGWAQGIAPQDFRGTNYVPATTRAFDTATAMLPHDNPNGLVGEFSSSQVEDEIAFIASHGLNTVRVFTSFYGFLVDKQAYRSSLRELARICTRHGVRITFVFWNLVAVSVPSSPGSPLELWHDLAGSTAQAPTNPVLYQGLRARSAALNALYGHLVPPWAPHFAGIHAEPGRELLLTYGGDPAPWPFELGARVDEYIDEVASFFGQDPAGQAAFASYDLFNEPNILPAPNESTYLEFIAHTFHRVQLRHPNAACTVGWAAASSITDTLDQELENVWNVHPTYLSGHSYARPEGFAEDCANRAAYARSRGMPFVMSEFHRTDRTSGVVEAQLSLLVRHGLAGQMWGLIQSNAFIDYLGAPMPIDGVAVSFDPGNAQATIPFLTVNTRDAAAIRAWSANRLVPTSFARVILRDAQGTPISMPSAGTNVTIDVDAPRVPLAPILLVFGIESTAMPSCRAFPEPMDCVLVRGLGPLYYSPSMVPVVSGVTDVTGRSVTPYALPLPPNAAGQFLGVSAYVGFYPFTLPETNVGELTRLSVYAIQ